MEVPAYLPWLWLSFFFLSPLELESLTALRCLSYFLIPKTRKKTSAESMDIPHILVDTVVSILLEIQSTFSKDHVRDPDRGVLVGVSCLCACIIVYYNYMGVMYAWSVLP